MDRHKELYKENSSTLSPRQHSRINRELQQKKRANHRNDMYFSSRNISVSPTPTKENAEARISATSTPAAYKENKKFLCEYDTTQQMESEDKENLDKTQLYASRIAIAALKTDPEKRSRQEAYLMRFIEWKERKKQQEAVKKDAKKPFLPPSKNCGLGTGCMASDNKITLRNQCELPKSKKFKAPDGLIHPKKEEKSANYAEQKKKRLSVYTVVPTPPRKQLTNTIEKKKPVETVPRRLPLIKQPSVRCLSAERPTVQKVNTLDKVKLSKAPPNLKAVSEKKPQTWRVPSATTAKPEARVFVKPRPLKLPPANDANKQTLRSSARNVATTEDTKSTARKPLPSTVRIVKPIRTGKDAIVPTTIAKPTRTAVATKPMQPKPKPSSTVGAIAKAKQLRLNKQKDEPPQKQNKLSVSLKSKRPITRSAFAKTAATQNPQHKSNMLLCVQEAVLHAETPTLPVHNPFPAFVTSTQVKEQCGANAFADMNEEISPVEPGDMKVKNEETQCQQRSRPNSAGSSAKRALMQTDFKPSEAQRKSRFNFVRYSEAGTDLETTIPDGDKDDTIQMKESELPTSATFGKNNDHISGIEKIKENSSEPPAQPRKSKFNFVRYSEAATDAENTIIVNEDDSNVKETPVNDIFDTTVPNDINKTIINDVTIMPVNRTPDTCGERPSNYLSPFVTVTRGKVSLKAEKERRDSVYLPPTVNGTPRTETANEQPAEAPQTPVEVRRALETVLYFRKQLADEIARLHTLCDQWETYKNENLPRLQETGGEDMINVTIGQTKLLTSKKFMQFNGLIDRCESGATGIGARVDDGSEDTKPIRAIDLEGFWSMISLQIDNVDKRFENLEEWRKNDWNDPNELKAKSKKNLTKVKKAKTTKATTKPKANSALQEMMRKMHADMRKKKAAANNTNTGDDVILTPKRTLRRQSQVGGTPQQQQQQQQREQRRSGAGARRLSIIVPDRKSLSAAATIVSIPSPLGRRNSNNRNSRKLSQDSPKLRPHLDEFNQSVTNLRKECDRNDLLKAALKGATAPQQEQRRCSITATPPTAKSTSPLRSTCPKSILKTPGTAKGQRKSVIFNSKLQVRKFKFTVEDPPSDEEQDEAAPKQSPPKLEFEQEDLEKRTYKLRGRKVVLRPSSEFEIPK